MLQEQAGQSPFQEHLLGISCQISVTTAALKSQPCPGLALGYIPGLCPRMGKPPVLLSALGCWNKDFILGKLCLKWHKWESKSGVGEVMENWCCGEEDLHHFLSMEISSAFSFVLSCFFLSSRILVWGSLCCSCLTCLWVWGCTSSWEDEILIVFLWSPLRWVNQLCSPAAKWKGLAWIRWENFS